MLLAATAKAVSRAFNGALAESGGSIPIWLILNALKSEPRRS
jgi:MarR family transcriptional regulator for hemolysin